MKSDRKNQTEDDFIAAARRAFRRVARQLRAENARLDLPLIFGENGKLRLVQVRHARRKRLL
ncbi:MAG: hypothetical protein HYY24_07090 [Verrucomicrobia bacterium]|nr:hypothetical protein [Verrucomicrobiota bacterium]